jgi:hypothetical protein
MPKGITVCLEENEMKRNVRKLFAALLLSLTMSILLGSFSAEAASSYKTRTYFSRYAKIQGPRGKKATFYFYVRNPRYRTSNIYMKLTNWQGKTIASRNLGRGKSYKAYPFTIPPNYPEIRFYVRSSSPGATVGFYNFNNCKFYGIYYIRRR